VYFSNKEAKVSERLPAGRQEARMSENAFSNQIISRVYESSGLADIHFCALFTGTVYWRNSLSIKHKWCFVD
jgi:hypothetical protein